MFAGSSHPVYHSRRSRRRRIPVRPSLPQLVAAALFRALSQALIPALLLVFAPSFVSFVAAQSPAPGDFAARQPVNPFLEEEAPPTIFSIDRTDAEVDLYLLGSWSAMSRVSTGFAFHPPLPDSGKRFTFPYEYPGFETELFSQTTDLLLSLWLYNRYFFEASFSDDSDTNTVAAGYSAVDDELVRELVVGNVPLSVESYPFQYTGSPGARTGSLPMPGAVLRLQTERTYHELLVQLENSRLEQRRFSGGGVLQEARIRPEDYERELVFVLPHAPVTNLTVYVLDRDGSVEIGLKDPGDGSSSPRSFRALSADAGDYTVDTARGIVRLAGSGENSDRFAGRTIAAVYDPATPSGSIVDLDSEDIPTVDRIPFDLEADGGIVTYGSQEIPLDRYRLSIVAGSGTGRRGVLLREPGLYSPFAAANHYVLPADARTAVQDGTARIRLVRRGTRTPVEEESAYRLEPLARGALLQVVRLEGQATPGPGDRNWKYPFAASSPATAAIYGPRSHPRPDLAGLDILVEYRSTEGEMFLDGDIVPGTVGVSRNGRPVPGATVDYATGEITIPGAPGSEAQFDVRYRVYSPGEGAGDLVAISGNRWRVNETTMLSAAAGLRWTIADDLYSRELEEHPGQVTLSAGLEHERDKLKVDAAGAVQIYQPDTTGVMRLFGGEAESFSIAPRETTLFPAPHPRSVPVGVAPVEDTDRAVALYRDLWTTDGLGSSALLDYTAGVTPDPDREGRRMGPYLARSSDAGYTGTVGVLEWESLTPGAWVGALLRVTSPPVDLRDAREISVTYRYVPDDADHDGGNAELLIQLGALAEDLDNDGVVDRGRSAVDPTFEFTFPPGHPREGSVRRVGQDAPGLAAPHREDVRRDGILLEEQPEAVLDFFDLENAGTIPDAFTVKTDGAWRTHTVTISAREAARLGDLRGVRFLVRNPSAATDDLPGGRLVIGEVTVERAGNAAVIAGRDRNATAGIADDRAEPSLRSSFGIVRDRFNPERGDQPVLTVRWDDPPGATSETVAAEIAIPDFSPDRYGRLTFYTYLEGEAALAPAENIVLRMMPYRDSAPSRTLAVEIPADLLYSGPGTNQGAWRAVHVDLDSGSARVEHPDGSTTAIPRAALPRDLQGTLRRVTVAAEGVTGAGRLFLDEVHATDPQAGTALAGRVGVVWTTPLGEGDLTLEQDLAAQTSGFRSVDSVGSAGAVSGRSRASFRRERLFAAGEASYRFVEEESLNGALGHELTVPIGPKEPLGLEVEEEFLRDFDQRLPLAERRIAVNMGTAAIGRYRYAHRHRTDTRETLLGWNANVNPPGVRRLTFSAQGAAELRDLDRVISTGSYTDSWLETSRFLLLPGPSGADSRQERRVDGGVTAALDQWPLELSGGWRNRSATAGTQESIVGMSVSVPLQFTPPGSRAWTLTPGYRRAYRVTERLESENFSDDAAIWGSAIRSEPTVFTSIPGGELFQSPGNLGLDALRVPQEARSYETEARLRFSRDFASRVRDLWIPADAEAVLRRTTAWETDSRTDRRLWQISTTAVAINLFGVQGSRPAATWYKSDEFRNRLLLAITENVPGEVVQRRLELKNDTVLIGFRDNEAALSSSAAFVESTSLDQVTRETKLATELTYTRRRPGYPPLEVFRRMREEPYYRHRHRLRWDGSYRDGDLRDSELLLGHETALVVGENGEIRLFADLGWQIDPAEYDQGALHVVGFQGGIEGVLRY